MNKLVIPHYAEGLKIDWTKAVPIDYKNVAMYVAPNLRINFKSIWCPRAEASFEIGKFMEDEPNIRCRDFEDRFESFEPYLQSRVRKVFKGDRDTIFFDLEEADVLAATFINDKYTAVIEFVYEGEEVKLTELPEDLREDVEAILKNYNVIYPMTVEEYKQYCEAEKVRVIKTITPNGGKKMKKKGINNILKGLLIEGICITGAIIGAKLISKGSDEFTGKYKDIIMVKHDRIRKNREEAE